ncbi:hypothetical protein [Streptomyces sp. NPDC048172]|uniref:hypothetical protein n=1 Tax=Streptomyces sp. NPDC048172 TaxID=3365505 RepID=UPI0037244968
MARDYSGYSDDDVKFDVFNSSACAKEDRAEGHDDSDRQRAVNEGLDELNRRSGR